MYDNGSLFEPKVLDITDELLLSSVSGALRNIASVCLVIGYPTVASIPHSVINGYKNVLAVSIGTDYTFPKAQKVRECRGRGREGEARWGGAFGGGPSHYCYSSWPWELV